MASFRKAIFPKTLYRSIATATRASSLGHTMPPGFTAKLGHLETFVLPEEVRGHPGDRNLGKAMIDALKRDGIFQISMTDTQKSTHARATEASKCFFGMPHEEKAACADANSFSGYIASGEEVTDGIADYSEIFTVTKDISSSDKRVSQGWPCHGPCPWPNDRMKSDIQSYVDELTKAGECLLSTIELGLDVPRGSLTKYTADGWHHLRTLRFPVCYNTNRKGKGGRGIGSHTDYGLLVIAAQDDVGGLFIRPPANNERYANWEQSSAGLREDDTGWVYVPPVPEVFTVFPGDMLQYMTNSALVATPHKVGLNTSERFAFAYFHEPRFEAVVRPLPGYEMGQEPADGIHYGAHFTNMFLRNYPDRITTREMMENGRYALLQTPELREDVA